MDSLLKVQVSGSTGFANGTESIVEDTKIYDPTNPSNTILLVPNLISPDGTLQQQLVADFRA